MRGQHPPGNPREAHSQIWDTQLVVSTNTITWSEGQSWQSIVAQSHQRIDPRGPSRRQITRKESDGAITTVAAEIVAGSPGVGPYI